MPREALTCCIPTLYRSSRLRRGDPGEAHSVRGTVVVIGRVKLECNVMIPRWATISERGDMDMMPAAEVGEEYFPTRSLTETASF